MHASWQVIPWRARAKMTTLTHGVIAAWWCFCHTDSEGQILIVAQQHFYQMNTAVGVFCWRNNTASMPLLMGESGSFRQNGKSRQSEADKDAGR